MNHNGKLLFVVLVPLLIFAKMITKKINFLLIFQLSEIFIFNIQVLCAHI